ncbi:hypothetical protein AURDEDRAFT_111715 [Auricularia subglabra TFB-10046 SS5]|nr:hypothetical protein AURDEDRAFT_111715 [Auricularia subglabra TFB-10046 SS5]
MLRVQCRNRPTLEGAARTLQRIRGAPLAGCLEVLRIDAPFSHVVVLAVADAFPALKGLSIDCDAPPNYTSPAPWSAEQWTDALRKFSRLSNFRLRFTGHPASLRRVWAQHKRGALANWHAACPTLRSIAFPGEKGYWVLSARTGAWREPAQ